MKFLQPYKFHSPTNFQKKELLSVLHSLDIECNINGVLLNIEGKNIPINVLRNKPLYTDEILDGYSFKKLVSLAHHLGWDDTKKGRAQDQTTECLHKFIYTRNINHMPIFVGMIRGRYVNITNTIRMHIVRANMIPAAVRDYLYPVKENILESLSIK